MLLQVARGSTNAEIAFELFVSLSTVKAHITNLMTELGCGTGSRSRSGRTRQDGSRADPSRRGRAGNPTPFANWINQREELRTVAVWAAGDSRPNLPGGQTGPGGHPEVGRLDACALLACLLDHDGIRQLLKRHEVDADEVTACVKRACR